MKWLLYTLGAVLVAGTLAAGAYKLMPDKASWAKDFSTFTQSLPEKDPLRQQLNPLLSDGKLSLWELSQIHCEFDTGCAIDIFLSSYTHAKSVDIFAATTLEILKKQQTQRSNSQQKSERTGSPEKAENS